MPSLTRAGLLGAADAARPRNPAWLATGGLTGSSTAVESTFVRPVQLGAVWVHELNGAAQLVMRDPRDVVEQIQRAANGVLRARGRTLIREDGTWGPRTRDAMRELMGALDGPRSVAAEGVQNTTLMEQAILAAYYGGRGQVVLPRRAEVPAFTTGQEVPRMPAGHTDFLLLADSGRVLEHLGPVGGAPPVCNPRLVLSALPPGKSAESWATMDDPARLEAWRTWAAANPGASIPGCPPGASVAAIELPQPVPVPVSVPPAAAGVLGATRAVVIAGAVAAFGYVVYVAARELRSPSGRGSRRVRRFSVPRRAPAQG